MKAVAYKKPLKIDEPNVFLDIDIAQPIPTEHDLLIEIKAVSINPVDSIMRLATPSDNEKWQILGHDAVGVVSAVGSKVSKFKIGDEVFYAGSNQRDGSYAEYQLVDERLVGHKPKKLSYAEAAAVPLTSITAWEMLFSRLQVQNATEDAKTILVIGASGGVGSITIELLKAQTDLVVVGTASNSQDEQSRVKALGADYVVDHTQSISQQFSDLKLDLPHFIFSISHTEDHMPEILKLLAPEGHLGFIDNPQNFPLLEFKARSCGIHMQNVFTRSMFKTANMSKQGEILDQLSELLDTGKIKAKLIQNVGKINAENITLGTSLVEKGKSTGKVILEGF